MAQVVQAICPNCRKVLRIPAEWLGQAMKCKHCGQVFQPRPRPTVPPPVNLSLTPPPPTRPAPAPPVAAPVPPPTRPAPAPPVAAPVGPLAMPVQSPASGADPFEFDHGSTVVRPRRRRRSGAGGWVAAVVAVCLLGAVATAGFFAWPYLARLQKEIGQGAGANEGGTAGTVGGTIRPGARHGEESPGAGSRFPRRALLIGVSNYLYFNPVQYGTYGPSGHNLHTLANQLNKGLRIPLDQVTELSDATPEAGGKPGRGPRPAARPPLKPVIEQTVGEFLDTSRTQDRLLLLFAGHAIEADGAAYLVPVEGEAGNKDTLIPLAWLYDRLEKCKARQKVLVLDVCRFDPSRGFERPGSGSSDAKVPGTMTAKLDEALANPPAGVQVWSACTKDQFSYEYDDNGVFLEALWNDGSNIPGVIQHPEDPMRVDRLVDVINKKMASDLRPYRKMQTSRLAGMEAEDGAPYDPSEPPPSHVEPKLPVRQGDLFVLDQLRQLLAEIDVPPIRITKDEVRLRPEAMPFFTKKVMQNYAEADGEDTDFRKAVKEAVKVLNTALKGKRLRDEWPVPANEQKFKDQVTEYQRKEVAGVQRELTEAFDSLKKAGTPEARAQESKRWQAHYDFILARLQEELAYFNEYQGLQGQIKKELPQLDPKLQTGWRVASQTSLSDRDAKKLAKDADKTLDKIIKDYPNTPWAVLAKRDKLTALGMEWQAARLGQ
jgi:hypothetical protein